MKQLLQVEIYNYIRRLILIITLILTISKISAQEFETDSDFQYYYQTNYKKGSIKTLEDSILITSNYKQYLTLYDSARTNAKDAVPDLNLDSCNLNLYLKTIDFLMECFSFDSLLTVKKVKQDNYFDGIRNEYEIRQLFYGLSFFNPQDVRSFIMGKTYKTSTPGSSYFPITTLTLNENDTWLKTYHKNAEEMINYWQLGIGNEPELIIGTETGIWKLDGHVLILFDKFKNEIKRIKLTEPHIIDDLYYPDPNDMSQENYVRHFWKCGKCGCN
ncbi:MAG: hypothetical protein IPO21_07540 [Bacteroidales bacterium]|nr:hypothetical protein [Bacteroidales bacterium]